MALAAVRPAPIARITVAAPVTASPPARRPCGSVVPRSSAVMQPRRVVSRPAVVAASSGLGEVPSAMITTSHSISNSEPSFTTGERRPLSSGSPNSISTHRRPVTQPFSSPRTAVGLVSMRKRMPSSGRGGPPRRAPELFFPNGGRRSWPRRPAVWPCARRPSPRCRRHDHHALSDVDRGVVRLVVGMHQVGPREELVGRDHAVEVLARDAHEAGQPGARADEYGVIAFVVQQRVDRHGAAHDHVGLDPDAQPFDLGDLARHDPLLREAEFGNAVNQHAAHLVQRLENLHFVAHAGQVAGAGQPGRAAADDGDLAAVAHGGRLHGAPCSSFQSPTKRSSLPTATGSLLMPRMHEPSHWLSCGQTRPQIDGSELSSEMMSAASCNRPLRAGRR